MDRTTIIGFILIAVVLMVWIWMNSPPPQKIVPNQDSTTHRTGVVSDTSAESKTSPGTAKQTVTDSLGKFFSHLGGSGEKVFSIDADHFKAEISSKGGSIKSWELKDFKTWNGYPVDLVNQSRSGDLNLLFYTSDGKLINTKSLVFQPLPNVRRTIRVSGNDSVQLDFAVNINTKSRIVKSYTFTGDRYSFDVVYRFEDMDSILSNYEYQSIWETGLRYQERNSLDESNSAKAYAYAGGELTDIDASSFDQPPVKQNISGRVKWVAIRNKYFGLAIIARSDESQGAYLEGTRARMPDNGAQEYYSVG